ncbi:MAG: transcriptional regulator [Clostridia bacterium]|nr:transcriptional regulator [Clostridia bacterium]
MDEIDLRILNMLKENSRYTVSEISKTINLSIPAVSERIRKMEASKIIEQYTIKVNRESMNYKTLAFVFVTIDETENIEGFRRDIVNNQSVLECHHVVGEYDYLLKVLVEDPKSLEHFLSNQLKKIKGVIRTNTIISLLSLKENMTI